MQRVADIDLEQTLKGLISSSVSGTVTTEDEAFAAIKSFESSFERIRQTPEMVRVMLQNEFNFEGVIDCAALKDKKRVLKDDWYDSTFLVVDYSEVLPWLEKALEQSEKGRLVVALVPARTNTKWFHEVVLQAAKEVRFIRGHVLFDNNSHTTVADCIVVYRAGAKRRPRKKGSVAIIRCHTDLKRTRFSAELTDPPSP